MADKLLIPIEAGAEVDAYGHTDPALAHLTCVRFRAPLIIAESLERKIPYSLQLICFGRAPFVEDSVEGSTYYVPPPSRFLPADATPEQQLEAVRLFDECCSHVRWSHRRALAGEKVGLPQEAISPILMEQFRYANFMLEFSSKYEDRPVLESLKSMSLHNFNEDERFYVQKIIGAIETSQAAG